MSKLALEYRSLRRILARETRPWTTASASFALRTCLAILRADTTHPRALELVNAVVRQLGYEPRGRTLPEDRAFLLAQFADALRHAGTVQIRKGKLDEAANFFRKALEIRPNFPEAQKSLGDVCAKKAMPKEAMAHYRRAIALRTSDPEAYQGLGIALLCRGKVEEAIVALGQAASLNPRSGEALSLLEHAMRHACEWRQLDEIWLRLIGILRTASGCVNPFTILCTESSPEQQLLCSKRWATQKVADSTLGPISQIPQKHLRSGATSKITVGYLSADFQEHATMHLISRVFGLHDRSRFRILGYSFGFDDGSPARKHAIRSMDRFTDIRSLSHEEAARRIRKDRVGILVDLKGYTAYARPQILALRAAPVQANYLGYPGTMGMAAVDYAVVDHYVAPSSHQSFFAEHLVHLPDSYQANSPRVTARRPSRSDCGLPKTGFVFCCFNASYKITPKMFDVWVWLLRAVKGSTLWLLKSNSLATTNLRREAQARGISPRRLVFASDLPNAQHMARLALADLFLDTFPYNAHTTASDTLWAGCPIVTLSGQTFASRVAGSLLHSVGCPELVCRSFDEYERVALELARNPARLQAIRRQVKSARRNSALFDAQRFTRHLESAFEMMWSIYRKGERPRSFAVSPEVGL